MTKQQQIVEENPQVSNTKQREPPLSFNTSKIELYVIIPLLFLYQLQALFDISKKSNSINEQTPFEGLEKSWFGYYRDASDHQWNSFREIVPIFLFAIMIFNLITYTIKKQTQLQPQLQKQYKYLIFFYLVSGIAYLIFLFRGGFFLWIAFTLFNYMMQKLIGQYRFYPIILWTFSIWSLYYNFYHKEDPYIWIGKINENLGKYLYMSSKNAMVQWDVIYNMTMLRVISYCFDKHWELLGKYKFDAQKHVERCDDCKNLKICYKARSEEYLQRDSYKSLSNYYAYLTYIPLFVTGPQITFNAFVSQVQNNQKAISNKKVIIYCLRAINNLLILELFTHLNYSSALSKIDANRQHWLHFSVSECMFMAFNNLIFIWLKFLTLWRLARAAAMIDGIDSPENMNRCIINNKCLEGFWRSWHRGFNQWLIRYIFIPIGGSKTKTWNVWVIFSFVAIWHDFELNLLIWAWAICAAMVPEIMIKKWASKQKALYRKHWFKILSCFLMTLHMWGITTANMIGFGNGYQNISIIFQKFQGEGQIFEIMRLVIFMYPITLFCIWNRSREQKANKDQGF